MLEHINHDFNFWKIPGDRGPEGLPLRCFVHPERLWLAPVKCLLLRVLLTFHTVSPKVQRPGQPFPFTLKGAEWVQADGTTVQPLSQWRGEGGGSSPLEAGYRPTSLPGMYLLQQTQKRQSPGLAEGRTTTRIGQRRPSDSVTVTAEKKCLK